MLITNTETAKERPILFSGPMVRAIIEGRKTMTRRVVKFRKPFDHSSAWPTVEYARDGMPIWWSNPPSDEIRQSEYYDHGMPCPHGKPGDRLWVRETWKPTGLLAYETPRRTRACGRFAYKADTEQRARDRLITWRPSIHMPRWASRFLLEILNVRPERVQMITPADALAEGIRTFTKDDRLFKYWACDPCEGELRCAWRDLPTSPVEAYARLWDALNAKPKPVLADGRVHHYVSFPWAGEQRIGSHRGKPHYVTPNPWVWVVEFKRIKAQRTEEQC